MYEGIHKTYNAHALRAVTKTPYLPETRLGIGEAEHLAALENIISYPHIAKAPVLPDLYDIAIENATIDGQGSLFTPDDFSNTGFIGNQIGGL